MQLKNLIFVFTVSTASVTSVLGATVPTVSATSVPGATPAKHDYVSFKSCINGHVKSCPDFKQLYSDEAHYKQHQKSLKKCLKGKKNACKEWMENQPDGMKKYFEAVKSHVKTAKNENFDIGGALDKTYEARVEEFKQLASSESSNQSRSVNLKRRYSADDEERNDFLIQIGLMVLSPIIIPTLLVCKLPIIRDTGNLCPSLNSLGEGF